MLCSCKGDPVLDSAQLENLRKGNVSFLLEADLIQVQEIAQMNPSASFYAGLLVRSQESSENWEPEGIPRSLPLFEAALNSPALRIREEAARELLIPVLEGKIPGEPLLTRLKKAKPQETGETTGLSQDNPLITLEAAVFYAQGRFNQAVQLLENQPHPSSWDKALGLTAALPQGQPRDHPEQNILRGRLLGFFLSGAPDKSAVWAFREIQRRSPDFFTEPETAAVLGRFALSHASYEEGLRYFRQALAQDKELFFQYPELTGDLGRSFQYTRAQDEGITLFLAWDKSLQEEPRAPLDPGFTRGNPSLDTAQIRYRLLYFSGRIERQKGNYLKAREYFQSALPFAPDPVQEDACIWYILNTAWLNQRQDLLPLLDAYLSRWHDPSYFADLLDLLCCYLTANRQWIPMLELFSQLRFHADGATTAKYAYILGRAISEGYISELEAGAGLNAVGMGTAGSEGDRKTLLVRSFFRIALEEGNASFYYRALSASHLGDTVLAKPELTQEQDPQGFLHKEEMELLLGFFEFGAASYSTPYLRKVREDLSIPELRVMAKLLSDRQEWIESIRLVSAYMDREDYEIGDGDLYLYYPRAFMEIIEENAQEMGIPPELLYGLIRTESAFDHRIVSHAGAIGLSQLMPKTAEEEANRIKRRGGPNYLDNLDLRNPGVNVHIGASYLSYLLNLMNSPMEALLSYNGGYNRVRRWRKAEPNLPEDLFLETIELIETREYGKRVLGAAAAYGYLYFDMTMEAVVEAIFSG